MGEKSKSEKMGSLERARQLQGLSMVRDLTPVELEEAADLAELLSESQVHAAAWAHDAIQRTYRRLRYEKKHGRYKALFQASLDSVRKRGGGGMTLSMNRAPSEEVLGRRKTVK